MALVIPVLVALVILYLLSYWNSLRLIWKFNYYGSKIPGPPAHPITGNLELFKNLKSDEMIPMYKEQAKKARERGDTVIRFILPGKLVVWPLNGKAASQIIESTTEIHKGVNYNFFNPWIGGGLLVSVGDHWKSHRKMLTPAFHFAKLEGYFDVFNEESKIFIECVEKFAASGETVDLFAYINRFTLDVICGTAMGTKVNAQFNHDHPYLKAVEGYTKMTIKYSTTPILWNNFIFWALGYKKQRDELLLMLKKFTADVIEERKAALESGEEEKGGSKRKMNFLDLMLSMTESNALSEEELRQEVDTFMFGGHDTTTCSASWTCWNLAHNPDVQDKVYNELLNVCGEDPNEDVTYEQVNKLHYMDRVLKESKRLIAPVPAVQRNLQNDMVIDGYTIPAGANISIPPVVLHSNPHVFEDPEKFNPDRFLPEECAKRNPYDYVPFSAGIKNCIGQKFSVLNEKVLIAHLIRNFRIEPCLPFEGTRPCLEVVAKPSNGIPVKLIRRF